MIINFKKFFFLNFFINCQDSKKKTINRILQTGKVSKFLINFKNFSLIFIFNTCILIFKKPKKNLLKISEKKNNFIFLMINESKKPKIYNEKESNFIIEIPFEDKILQISLINITYMAIEKFFFYKNPFFSFPILYYKYYLDHSNEDLINLNFKKKLENFEKNIKINFSSFQESNTLDFDILKISDIKFLEIKTNYSDIYDFFKINFNKKKYFILEKYKNDIFNINCFFYIYNFLKLLENIKSNIEKKNFKYRKKFNLIFDNFFKIFINIKKKKDYFEQKSNSITFVFQDNLKNKINEQKKMLKKLIKKKYKIYFNELKIFQNIKNELFSIFIINMILDRYTEPKKNRIIEEIKNSRTNEDLLINEDEIEEIDEDLEQQKKERLEEIKNSRMSEDERKNYEEKINKDLEQQKKNRIEAIKNSRIEDKNQIIEEMLDTYLLHLNSSFDFIYKNKIERKNIRDLFLFYLSE